jgi:hypothetical protein
MHRDRDVDLGSDLPPAADGVVQDLELDTVLAAMAAGDEFLRATGRTVLSSLAHLEAVLSRIFTGRNSRPIRGPRP